MPIHGVDGGDQGGSRGLTEIDLESTGLKRGDIARVLGPAFARQTTLQRVTLGGIGSIKAEPEEVETVAQWLRSWPNLQKLRWTFANLGDTAVQPLLAALPEAKALIDLDLSDNNFSVATALRLAEVLPQCATLEHLRVARQPWAELGLLQLLPGVAKSNIDALDISAAKTAARGDTIDTILDAVMSCPKLQEVRLGQSVDQGIWARRVREKKLSESLRVVIAR